MKIMFGTRLIYSLYMTQKPKPTRAHLMTFLKPNSPRQLKEITQIGSTKGQHDLAM